jgi:hypothetical protein
MIDRSSRSFASFFTQNPVGGFDLRQSDEFLFMSLQLWRN